MQFSLLLFVICVVNANSYNEVAYLGDICSPPYIPCVTPNSQCFHTDNIFYDRQSFCICMPGFEPSTGHCIGDNEPTTTSTASSTTTTTQKLVNDATNSSDVVDNSTLIADETLIERPPSPTRRPQIVRRPSSGHWPTKAGKYNKLPPNNPIYEPPFPALTTSSSIRDDDVNFQAATAYSTTSHFLHLRLNPYPSQKMKVVSEEPANGREESSVPKNPSRDISPELLAAVTSMSRMYDFRTITESPYKMKLPQQANLFHNDIKPIPYQVTTVEPSKNDSREGVVAGTRSYVPLHILLDTSTTKSQQRSSESRSQLTKFYKNRYPNAAVSRLAPDPVNRGIDSIIKNTTPKLDSTTVGMVKASNIFDAVKNSAPDIFNFVKSKMGFNAQLLTMTTTKASNAAVASRIMADNKIDTSKRDKESSSSGFLSTTMTTRKAKPLLLKIVASNSSNVIKKPRIIFNG